MSIKQRNCRFNALPICLSILNRKLQENELSSVITMQTVPLECTHRESRFRLQENELFSVITQTIPLERTHQELSFEWSHL